MGEAQAVLLAELDRIVSSPYPTQLKSLRDILFGECTQTDINRCLRLRCCSINKLALCLLEGLRQWPYVLDIVTRLSCNLDLRNALLRHEPCLLSDLAVQAAKIDDPRSKYMSATVSMLSQPLPDDAALPAAIQTLFLSLVEAAAEHPSTTTVKPLYTLLSGTSTALLGLLPHKLLSHFEEQMMGILRTSVSRADLGTDQHLSLRCLAVISLAAKASEEQLMLTSSFYQTQELLASTQPDSPRWHAAELSKFFTEQESVSKTIRLLALQAIGACSSSGGSLDERGEVMGHINDLVSEIPRGFRDSWCAANSAIVQKLQQKAVACEDCGLRLQLLGFASQLCKPVFLQMATVESIRSLVSLRQIEALFEAEPRGAAMAWSNCLKAVLDIPTIEALLHNSLAYLLEMDAESMLASSPAMADLVDRLSLLAYDHEDIAQGAMVALSTMSFQRQLVQLRRMTDGSQLQTLHGQDTSYCASSYHRAVQSVSLKVSNFLLTMSLTGVSEQSLPQSVPGTLLGLHAASAEKHTPCPYERAHSPRKQNSTGFVEFESTPAVLPVDWREGLRSHLASDATAKQEALARLFTQACADLEQRCEGIEQPLRDEKACRQRLQQTYERLQEDYAGLEGQLIDRKLHYDSLEADRDSCFRDLDEARENADGLLQRVTELEQTLRTTSDQAEAELAGLRSAKENEQLMHTMTMAKKQEELEDVQERYEDLSTSIEAKRRELESARADTREASAGNAALRTELDQARDLTKKWQKEVEGLQSAAQDSTHRFAQLEAEVEAMKRDHDRQREAQQEAHEQNLRQIKEHQRQNAEAANASHNESLDKLAIQHGEEAARLEAELASARQEADKAREQHSRELTKAGDELESAEQQIDRLQKRCKQKDKQIAEANAMRINLMAAMGIGPAAGDATQLPDLPHRSRASTARALAESQGQWEPAEMSPTAAASGAQSRTFDGRASFASNGSSGQSRSAPTPKRAKPRRSFIVASPAKHGIQLSTGTTARTSRSGAGQGRSSTRRQPLAHVSANQMPAKPASHTPSKGTKGFEDEEFDGETLDEVDMLGQHTAEEEMQIDLSAFMK